MQTPLARLDFRLGVRPLVTCAVMHQRAGAAYVSVGERQPMANWWLKARCVHHGELPESKTGNTVFAVGLFDGIAALDCLGVPVSGYVSVEKAAPSRRVVESHFPGVIAVDCRGDQ